MVSLGGSQAKGRGSFGIPEDVQEEMARNRAQQQKARAQQSQPTADTDEEPPAEESPAVEAQAEASAGAPHPELPTDKTAAETDPLKKLESIGVTLSEDDMHALLFKGSLEKTVELYPKPKLTATLKTLTGEELDVVDELLADDIENVKMTRDGAATRRMMWTISLAVVQLNGRPVRNLGKEDAAKNLSGRDLIRKRAELHREVLAKMAPPVLLRLMEIHTLFAKSLNELIGSARSPFL